jgi:hypothetical protein
MTREPSGALRTPNQEISRTGYSAMSRSRALAAGPRFDEVAVTHADHGMAEPSAKQHGLDMRRRSRQLR